MAANLPDIKTFIQAGIDPKTKLPTRLKDFGKNKEGIRKELRLLDEQDAVNRFVWYNLPCDLTGQELERMIYYKGQLCFFYDKDLEQFYFMPYALDGTIDFYGRYNTIHPVPMTSGIEEEVDKKQIKAQAAYLSTKKLKCVYGVKVDDLKEEDLYNSTVLLHDYTKQLSQTIISRKDVNEPLLDLMANVIPYADTSLLISTGIQGVRVQDADQQANVQEGARSMKDAALSGNPWVPIVGSIDFQELGGKITGKPQDYMLFLQSLDNFRLSLYGIDNGGLFEKKAHVLQSEEELNGGPVGLILQDGLSIRQHFCNVVNSIWGLGIWCEPAENIIGADLNGDGVVYNRNDDQSQSGVENEGGEENDL